MLCLSMGGICNKRRLTPRADKAIFASTKITGISIKLFFRLSSDDP